MLAGSEAHKYMNRPHDPTEQVLNIALFVTSSRSRLHNVYGRSRQYGHIDMFRCRLGTPKSKLHLQVHISGACLTDLFKAVLILLVRLGYFFLFHPLASFPGPLLAKGGDVGQLYLILQSRLLMVVHRYIGIMRFSVAEVRG